MSLFHVYIERPRSSAPGAALALARAIAEHYGIPAADLARRIDGGRFRVKASVDRATADSYARDLARLGAVCTIVSADAPPAATAQPVSLPRVDRAPPPDRPASNPSMARVPAPSAASAAPPAASAAPSAAASAVPSSPPSAAIPPAAIAMPPQDLGALSGDFPLTLSTLDGAAEDRARGSRDIPLPASFAPPEPEPLASASRKIPLPASFAPAPEVHDDGGSDVDLGTDDPVEVFDPFAPPETQEPAPELALAVETKPRKKAFSTPPPPSSAPPRISGTMAAQPPPIIPESLPARATPLPAPSASSGGWKGFLSDDGRRFLVGVAVAFVVGAVPSLLVGSARERAASAAIDTEVERHQDSIRTPDAYAGLDRVRAGYADRKRAERQSIAITTLLMWAVLSGGATFLWFRTIDWKRVLGDQPRA